MKPTISLRSAWEELSGTRLATLCLGALMALWAIGQACSGWISRFGEPSNPRLVYWLGLSGFADVSRSPWFVSVLGVLFMNLGFGTFELGRQAWTRKDRTSWWRAISHLALCGSLAGLALADTFGFRARVLVEEGMRIRGVELLHGAAPRDWQPYVEGGRPLEGYLDPGFEIERAVTAGSGDGKPALLRLYRDGTVVGSVTLDRGRPAQFGGLVFHLLGYVPGSAQNVDILVAERATGAETRFSAVSKNKPVDVEDYRFEVVDIQLPTDLSGAAVQIEYEARGRPAERFWIFGDHPDYDFAHRKSSARYFTLQEVRQRSAAEIQVGREPGALWFWGALAAVALLSWVAMMGTAPLGGQGAQLVLLAGAALAVGYLGHRVQRVTGGLGYSFLFTAGGLAVLAAMKRKAKSDRFLSPVAIASLGALTLRASDVPGASWVMAGFGCYLAVAAFALRLEYQDRVDREADALAHPQGKARALPRRRKLAGLQALLFVASWVGLLILAISNRVSAPPNLWLLLVGLALVSGVAVLALAGRKRIEARLGDPDVLAGWARRSVLCSFPWLTLHLASGSVSAYLFKGSYWAWQPWQGVGWMAWLCAALVLHLRKERDPIQWPESSSSR